jgi:iron complex transport system permease protein
LLGAVPISFEDIWNAIFAYNDNNAAELTVRIFRFPRVATAVLAGIGLSVSGLLMQTLFQNPLAGPYVLGINAGAGLLVALSIMTGVGFLSNDLGLIGAALLGAFASGLIILLSSLYVKTRISLLLIGIMFGSFSGALINVVQSYSSPNDLKSFMLWSFGSLQQVDFTQLGIFSLVTVIGLVLTLFLVKPLNLLVLGDKNASLMGVNLKSIRFIIILVTAIFVGIITAFCGPIAFIGLIVPNIVKTIYRTADHLILLVGTMLVGAILLLICDITMQLLNDVVLLPLNALTALIGAPVVIWIIVKKY